MFCHDRCQRPVRSIIKTTIYLLSLVGFPADFIHNDRNAGFSDNLSLRIDCLESKVERLFCCGERGVCFYPKIIITTMNNERFLETYGFSLFVFDRPVEYEYLGVKAD